MDIFAVIKELGPAAASVLTTYMFLQYLREERKANIKERAENRTEISNHLSGTVRVLQNLVDITQEHRKQTEKD